MGAPLAFIAYRSLPSAVVAAPPVYIEQGQGAQVQNPAPPAEAWWYYCREASAYYHGYVMAEMAVHQTRAFFLGRDGHLVDNPRVGPDHAKHYCAPGNAQTFNDTLRALTGSALSADAIVASCNLSVDEAVAQARAAVAKLPSIAPQAGPVELDVTVRVVHGREVIGTTEGGTFERMADDFEAWIGRGA